VTAWQTVPHETSSPAQPNFHRDNVAAAIGVNHLSRIGLTLDRDSVSAIAMPISSSAFRLRDFVSLIVLALIPLSLAYAASPETTSACSQTYDSTADGPRPDIKPFVGFRFRYPETFKLHERQEGIYAQVTKYGSNGTDELARFTVSWYEADDPNSNKGIPEELESMGKQWAENMVGYKSKTVSYTTRKIDGVMAQGATWEFTTDDSPPLFAGAARSYFVHQPGTTKGVRIDQYGTYLDPKLKSAKNLGEYDDLGRILETFKFVTNKKESASEPAAKMKPAEKQELTKEDAQAMGAAAGKWLILLDAGNYAENFATAAEAFRHDRRVEKWKQNHNHMLKEFGVVTDRDNNVSLTTRTAESDDGKETVTRVMKIPTTFTKTTGVEQLTMTKESGVWKVADYSIETKSQ
jgi:hypothetical protein